VLDRRWWGIRVEFFIKKPPNPRRKDGRKEEKKGQEWKIRPKKKIGWKSPFLLRPMIPFLFFPFKHCSSSYYYSFTLHPKCLTYILAASFLLPYHFRYVFSTPATSLDFMSPFNLVFLFISFGLLSYLRNGVWRNTNLLFFISFLSSLFCSQVGFVPLYRYTYMLQLAFLFGSENLISLFTSSPWKGEEMGGAKG